MILPLHRRAVLAIASWNVAFALVAACLASAAFAGSWAPYGPEGVSANIASHPTLGGRALLVVSPAPETEFRTVGTWFSSDAGMHWIGNPWRGAIGRPVLAGIPTEAWLLRQSDMLRSTDEGRSWAPVFYPTDLESPFTVAVNPADASEAVVASTPRVSITLDGGNWSHDAQPASIGSLAVDWSTRRVYVVAGDVLRAESVDVPGAWVDVASGASRVFAARGIVLYQHVSGALFRSTNGGSTFAPVAAALGGLDLCSVAFSPTTPRVYALSIAGQGLLRSDNAGATWVATGSGSGSTFCPSAVPLAVDAVNPDVLYLSTLSGVVRSIDGGASLQPFARASGAPGEPRYLTLDAANSQRRWAYPIREEQRTFLQSDDAGMSWTPNGTGRRLLAASRTRANTLFGARGTFFDEELAVSADGGSTWLPKVTLSFLSTSIFGPIGYGSVSGQLFVAEQGKPGVTPQPVPGIHVSTDDGETWSRRAAPPVQIRAISATPSSVYAAGYALAPGQAQLWRSNDMATSWQPVATFANPYDAASGNDIHSLAIDPAAPNVIYVGLALPPHLMRSDDGGASWSRANVGLGAGAVTSIVVDPVTPAIVYAAQFGSGVFRSTDRGLTWTALDQGLRDDSLRQLVLDPMRPGRLYAATDSGQYEVDLASGLPAGHRRAIEFFHGGFDHYFVSADNDEVAGLDAGVFAGWVRTGEGFRVAEGNGAGNHPTCRFFGVGFGAISSHFYTPYPGECEIVKADPNWFYEKIAFGLALPDPTTRGCPPDTRPLYRAWNRNLGGAPNHRYNADLASMQGSVLAQDWILEGEVRTLVFACVPVE